MAIRIQIVLFLLLLWALIPAVTDALAMPFFVLSIISIGMLHGGLDHITAFRHFNMGEGRRKWFLFLAGYMGIIVVYGVLWILSPIIGLSLFILMSCYHFGQLDMHEIARLPWNRLLYVSRGVYLLGLMIVAQFERVGSILQPITDVSAYLVFTGEWYGYLIGFLIVQHLVFLCVGTTKIALQTVADTVLTGLMFALLPPLLSFGLYFALWHSWDHLKLLNRYLNLPNWKSLILNAMPFTIMALVGIAGIILLFRQSLAEPGTVMYVLIGISLLTMPHMLLVDRVVEHDHH